MQIQGYWEGLSIIDKAKEPSDVCASVTAKFHIGRHLPYPVNFTEKFYHPPIPPEKN